MAKSAILLLALMVSNAFAWESIQAGYKDSCSDRICDEFKDLVCSPDKVCECKTDEDTLAPWVYTEQLDKCIPNEIQEELAPAAAIAQAQQHGGNNPGWGNSPNPRCTTINTQCSFTATCQQAYGNLASCNLHNYDPSLNRCECCHPIQETGFYNNRCHFVKQLGERCQDDEECLLSTPNTECNRGVCAYRNQHGSNDGGQHGSNNYPNGAIPVASISFMLVFLASVATLATTS